MPAPTVTEQAITEAHVASQEFGWWLGPRRGDLDEAAIVAGWLPSTGAGWVDQSATVLAEADVPWEGRGFGLRFTVADEARLTWADDLAVALVARSYLDGAYTAWALVAWGYLTGEGRQRAGVALDQTGERVATYAGYWGQINLPAHRFGVAVAARRNCCEAKS